MSQTSDRGDHREQRGAGVFQILFGEPYVPGNDGDVFEVGASFYEVLLRAPETLASDDANAYVFGERFPLDEYDFASSHGNDGAQTGLLDVTGAAESELVSLRDDPVWHEVYAAVGYDWNDRDALEAVRRRISRRILFVGQTVGGDVGANLFLHRNERGEVDGAIIDNHALFPGDEDE